METELEKQIKALFNCSYEELDDACWKAITNGNNYFGEGRVGITTIEEVPPYKEVPLSIRNAMRQHTLTESHRKKYELVRSNNARYYTNFGVYKYERNYAIGYKMTNKDGTYCGTTVYWSSYAGGRLSHGTRDSGVIPFKVDGTIPGIELTFNIRSDDGSKTAYFVCFGGALPSIEEKLSLITKIGNMLNYDISFRGSVTKEKPYAQWNHRYHNCKSGVEFIKSLLYGYYNIEPVKKQSIIKLSKLLGISLDNTLLYKYTYLNGDVEYVRVPSPFKKKEEEDFPF